MKEGINVQLMQFHNALTRAESVSVNGTVVTYMNWEDDGEEGMALRVFTDIDNILILGSDKICLIPNVCIVVSIGAKDYEFTMK